MTETAGAAGDRSPRDTDAVPHDPLAGPAPGLLSTPAPPPPSPTSLKESDEVASLHVRWARLTDIGEYVQQQTAAAGGGRVRAAVRARVVAAAATVQTQDRELIGNLIQAVDLVARRVDDLAARLQGLELMLQEVVDRLSEDLVRVQLALGGPPGTAASVGRDAGPAGPDGGAGAPTHGDG